MNDSSQIDCASLRVIVGNWLAHAGRPFVDVVQTFAAECRYVLEIPGEVFHQDLLALA